MRSRSDIVPGRKRPGRTRHRRGVSPAKWLAAAVTTILFVSAISFIGGTAQAATVTIGPSADAVVKKDTPNTNYGTAIGLKADNSPVEMSFLKFTVAGTVSTVTGAKLRLFISDPSNLGGQFRRVQNTTWAENTITWSNAPAADSTVIASVGTATINTFVDVDVFSVVKGDGTYSFRIDNTSSDGVIYASKEVADTTHRPQLVLTTNGTTPPPPPPPPTTPPPGANPCGTTATPPSTYDHVIWFIFENKTYSQVIGSPNAPYMTQLARQCGSVTTWSDAGLGLPSLPSYLALTSGSTQGVTTDSNPSNLPPITADNIFRQVRTRGLTYKSYQESMGSNCQLGGSGQYVVRHNPEAYYQGTGDRAACAVNNVPLGTPTSGNLQRDLANNTLPNFSLITPNVCNDMHDCSIATGDTWLAGWLPSILNSPTYKAGRTAIAVVFDEDTPIPNFIVAPSVIPGTTVQGSYSHYSLLRSTEEMLGIAPMLLNAGNAVSLRPALNF
ncbi:alkaline phosphatase family protein [Arthrobacter globiformis]|uniref:CBM96 family carbohydrate-binding protein n=1 Tax=Arthrobacter globiformis TaxID=1665 RepID=UPI00397A188D